MDDDASSPRKPAITWDGDVHELAGHIGEIDKLGRGPVAQHRTGPGMEHNRPEHGEPARLPGEGRIDAAMQLLPPAGPHFRPDGVAAQPGGRRLIGGYDAGLAIGNVAK